MQDAYFIIVDDYFIVPRNNVIDIYVADWNNVMWPMPAPENQRFPPTIVQLYKPVPDRA